MKQIIVVTSLTAEYAGDVYFIWKDSVYWIGSLSTSSRAFINRFLKEVSQTGISCFHKKTKMDLDFVLKRYSSINVKEFPSNYDELIEAVAEVFL